jgi:hypothetical protein
MIAGVAGAAAPQFTTQQVTPGQQLKQIRLWIDQQQNDGIARKQFMDAAKDLAIPLGNEQLFTTSKDFGNVVFPFDTYVALRIESTRMDGPNPSFFNHLVTEMNSYVQQLTDKSNAEEEIMATARANVETLSLPMEG